jgi:osmotically-inducible protein OsmY
MGLLTSQEADAVTDKARNVSGDTKVIRLFEYL